MDNELLQKQASEWGMCEHDGPSAEMPQKTRV